jgi:hypothetical protein
LVAAGVMKLHEGPTDGAFYSLVQRYLHHEFQQSLVNISLGVVLCALVISVVASLIWPKESEPES